jgi:hypothetical protein
MLTGLNWVLIHGCHNVSCKCVPNVYYFDKKLRRKTMFKCTCSCKKFSWVPKTICFPITIKKRQLSPQKLSVVY